MTILFRLIVALLFAACIASVSLAAAAHGIAADVQNERSHVSATADEISCPDCGTHRPRVCSQSCLASVHPIAPDVNHVAEPERILFDLRAKPAFYGLSPGPFLMPPIA
jgi:hypothetical protein